MTWKYTAKFKWAGMGSWDKEFEKTHGEVSAKTKAEAKKKAIDDAEKAFSPMWKLHSITVTEKL